MSVDTADWDLLQMIVLPVETGKCEVISTGGENQLG